MDDMYSKIIELCQERGIKPGRMCADTGLSRGMISDLKMGRTKELSMKNTKIVADYFGVSVDYLLGKENTKKAPAKQEPDDEDIKFALFGGADNITDEMYEEVKAFAKFVEEREKKKRK